MTFALYSERANGVAVLRATDANMDGDQVIFHALPPGFGDCSLLDVFVQVSQIATMMATPENFGPWVSLGVESFVDVVGERRWTRARPTELVARVFPEMSAWWRAAESLIIIFGEVDTNAAPTADLQVFAKVMRYRDQRAPAATGPLRFTS